MSSDLPPRVTARDFAVLEAMAANLAVIAADLAGIRERFGLDPRRDPAQIGPKVADNTPCACTPTVTCAVHRAGGRP